MEIDDDRGPRTFPSLICMVLVGLWSFHAHAQTDTLGFDGTFTWINAGRYTSVRESLLNPSNTVREIPAWSLISEFRPNFKITHEKIQLVARPRVRLTWDQTEVGDEEMDDDQVTDEGYSDAFMNEAFASWLMSDHFSFTVGLQSYQWGPAESLSPSNRIFHETALVRSALYEVRGKNIARLNISPSQSTSIVVLSEYEENEDEGPFIAEQEFGSTTAIKAEIAGADGANYLGLVLGGRQHDRAWIGEYGSLALPFPEGTSIYWDAAHQRGSSAYYPETQLAPSPAGSSEVVTLEQARQNEDTIETLGVAGIRYDFVQGTIVRLEYILNEPGYDNDERDMVEQALLSTDPVQQNANKQIVLRSLAPGLELPGERYVYGSIYIPNFLSITDLTCNARSLYSLTDQSASSRIGLEYVVGDAGTAFFSSTVNSGDDQSELAGFTRDSHLGGYRHVW